MFQTSSSTITPAATVSPSAAATVSATAVATSSTTPAATISKIANSTATANSTTASVTVTAVTSSASLAPTQSSPSGSPSPSFQPAAVVFVANLTSPVGTVNALAFSSSLPSTLLALRCDYASLVGSALTAVRIPSGTQVAANASAASLAAAIAAANAGTACPLALRLLGGARRRLAGTVSAPWASIAVDIGVVASASAADGIAALVNGAAAASFPRTTAAWAPVWGYSATGWLASIGSPLVLAQAAIVVNAASFSPVPAPPSAAPPSNIGAIVGGVIGGVAVVAGLVVAAICFARSRRLGVEELKAAAEAAQASSPQEPALS